MSVVTACFLLFLSLKLRDKSIAGSVFSVTPYLVIRMVISPQRKSCVTAFSITSTSNKIGLFPISISVAIREICSIVLSIVE